MYPFYYLLVFVLFFCSKIFSDPDVDIQILHTTEAFHTPFWLNNKTRQNVEELELMASLSGHADLPFWMKQFRRFGSPVVYFYGTPPFNEDGDLELDIIILDKFNYNTTRDRIKYRVLNREKTFSREIEMKFFDLDLQDFFEQNHSTNIVDIFNSRLWKKKKKEKKLVEPSASDPDSYVYLTKIARPIDVGGRFPLDPNEKECVIVRIGSTDDFTEELLRLENEVKRIKNRDPCPKHYKATTFEYVFREKKLHVDWCGFKLIRDHNQSHPLDQF